MPLYDNSATSAAQAIASGPGATHATIRLVVGSSCPQQRLFCRGQDGFPQAFASHSLISSAFDWPGRSHTNEHCGGPMPLRHGRRFFSQ